MLSLNCKCKTEKHENNLSSTSACTTLQYSQFSGPSASINQSINIHLLSGMTPVTSWLTITHSRFT